MSRVTKSRSLVTRSAAQHEMCKLPRAAANRLLWVWLENELQSGVGPPTSPLYLSIRQLHTSAAAAGIITIQSHNTLLLCCCRVIAQRADAQKTSRQMFGVDEICVENLGHNSNEITLIVFNLLWRAGRPSNSQHTDTPTSQQLGYSGEKQCIELPCMAAHSVRVVCSPV